MSKIVIPFSGYPICKINTNNLLTKKELSFLKNLKKKSSLYSSNVTNLKLSSETNILDYKELKKIKNLIWDNFDDYINNVLQIENQFYICNSWCTIQNKGDYHPPHFHSNHIFSAVYYAQANKSEIKFTINRSKIQEGFFFEYKIKNYNIYNAASWTFEVNSGDLIIFPGELQHESTVCESDDERVMVGSSYFIKGNLGSKERYNDISI